MSAAQALTSLRSKHLRTIEVLKETTAELDVLKKKFGNRGNYIDEDERERIKDSVRKLCNEELQKMEAELSNAKDTIQLLTKEKNVAYEKIKDLENSLGIKVYYPSLKYCGDNAAMIAYVGSLRSADGVNNKSSSVRARWPLNELLK